jgi:hypothetical protein
MSEKNWSFTFSHNHRRRLEVECSVHETMGEYLLVDSSKKHQDSVGSFYAARGNGDYVGRIHLIEGQANAREVIIHEALHAAFEVERHLGRNVTTRFEEQIVQCAAALASEMLVCLEDCSI